MKRLCIVCFICMSFSFLGARATDVYAGGKSASADTSASQPSNWKVSSLPSLNFRSSIMIIGLRMATHRWRLLLVM
ncbi:MAG: hypothetical protein IKY43_01075 [Bacteroidales bacterium]|nr:hypothetical protein [Bacteroidales bacterium]